MLSAAGSPPPPPPPPGEGGRGDSCHAILSSGLPNVRRISLMMYFKASKPQERDLKNAAQHAKAHGTDAFRRIVLLTLLPFDHLRVPLMHMYTFSVTHLIFLPLIRAYSSHPPQVFHLFLIYMSRRRAIGPILERILSVDLSNDYQSNTLLEKHRVAAAILFILTYLLLLLVV